MRRDARRQTNSVSLFPFLAVLVCAMGALIFLLVVTTRQVRLQAVARLQILEIEQPAADDESDKPDDQSAAAALPEPEPAELEPPEAELPVVVDKQPEPIDHRAIWKVLVAQLEEQRSEQQERLERQRRQLETAHREARQRTAQIAVNQTQLKAVRRAREQAADGQRNIRGQRVQLASLTADAQRRLQEVRSRRKRENSQYTFIPFDGASGTTRRPILIECTEDSIRFVPEDVEVRPADLLGFNERVNPLLAGSRALIHYWTAWNFMQKQPDDEPKPYVLLIVRPNGSVAFYLARKFLQHLDQPFGYELVEDDFELALPQADPHAQSVCRDAIDELLAERERVEQLLAEGQSAGRGLLRPQTAPDRFQLEAVNTRSIGSGWESGASNRAFGGVPRGQEGRPPAEIGGLDQNQTREALGRSGSLSQQRQPAQRQSAAGRDSRSAPHDPEASLDDLIDGRERQTGAGRHRAAEQPRQFKVGGEAGQGGSRSVPGQLPRLTNLPRKSPSGPGNVPDPRDRPGQKGWGESNGRDFIGFERVMKVRVLPDRILVGDEHVVRIQEDGERRDTPQILEETLQAIEQHARSWGKPPADSYWIPLLKFEVSPGGNQYYERLRGLLKEWGLHSTVEFRLDTPAPGSWGTR